MGSVFTAESSPVPSEESTGIQAATRASTPCTTTGVGAGGALATTAAAVVKKRTRASKPKVRTGCITCKIRRVKCGEEKPECVRCSSTGRKCDGYDTSATRSSRRAGGGSGADDFNSSSSSPSSSSSAALVRRVELARQEFLQEYRWNEALRSLRPIVADIDGTETERRFFHGFRAAAAVDGLVTHVSNLTNFWQRVLPQMSHHDEAVKHALVALGAAYQLFQDQAAAADDDGSGSGSGSSSSGGSSHGGSPPPPAGFARREDLEIFTIQQYNKSMSALARTAQGQGQGQGPGPGQGSQRSMELTLVCCLAFICLEALRSNHVAAVTHLTNGLRILDGLPDEAFAFLSDPGADLDEATGKPLPTPGSSDLDMREIIRMFGRLEISAAFFTNDIRPVISLRVLAARRWWDAADLTEAHFRTLASAHGHLITQVRLLIGRLYETRRHVGDAAFWARPEQERQQGVMRDRARRLHRLYERFMASAAAPAPGTPGYISMLADMQHCRCGLVFAEWMASFHADPVAAAEGGSAPAAHGGLRPTRPDARITAFAEDIMRDVVALAGDIMQNTQRRQRRQRREQRSSVGSSVSRSSSSSSSSRRLDTTGATGTAQRRIFTYDTGIVGPLYFVAVTTGDAALRQRALRLLQDLNVREGFWDAGAVRELAERVGYFVALDRWPSQAVPKTVAGMDSIPAAFEMLERLEALELSDSWGGFDR